MIDQSKQNPVPICTLPMVGGKIYQINSPALISSAMRNKDLSFAAHAKKWAVGAIGLTERQFQLIMSQYDELNHTIHSSLTGKDLYQMNTMALRDVADTLNAIRPESELHVPDVFLWLRDLMSLATMKALFGEKNPMTSKTVENLWYVASALRNCMHPSKHPRQTPPFPPLLTGTKIKIKRDYEQSLAQLSLNFKPEWIAPKGLRARTQMQETLAPYFVARHDQRGDAAEVIRKRSDQYRKLGLRSDELGVLSFDLPFASTTNTIPTLFWLFASIFSVPERARRVREEVAAVMEMTTDDPRGGRRTASVDISKLEKNCPYLMGCYREALRLYSDNLGQRRVLQDTVISDGSGKDYLLKEGCLTSWSPSVCHLNPAIWGDDVESFNPERWLNPSPDEEKRRRGAFIPFGGGRNLCPGRMFAQAELLGKQLPVLFISLFCLLWGVPSYDLGERREAPPVPSFLIVTLYGNADPGSCRLRGRRGAGLHRRRGPRTARSTADPWDGCSATWVWQDGS